MGVGDRGGVWGIGVGCGCCDRGLWGIGVGCGGGG